MSVAFSKFFLVAAIAGLFGLASTPASAQFMRMSPEERAKILKDSLGLDSAQTVKVTAILTESQGQMRDAFQSGGGDRESMRDTMTKITAKTDSKIEAVLTKEQGVKYEAMKKNRRPMGGGGMGRPRGNN
jgi:Spy/CpxP family protein refolding chaperone